MQPGDRLAHYEVSGPLGKGGMDEVYGTVQDARAVSYLEQAYAMDSQWLEWLGRDRVFDPLRQDPRFVELMSRLGFGN